MKISTSEVMRALDRSASEDYGIPSYILMEHAGHALYSLIVEKVSDLISKRVTVFCGPGNNGGDGFVVARKHAAYGAKVSVFVLADPEGYSEDAALNFKMAQRCDIAIEIGPKVQKLKSVLAKSDIIVDALLGTGIAREVSGIYAEAISLINAQRESGTCVVFSVDIPSGVNGDNGLIHGDAVKADYTMAFGLAKQGNILYPGAKNNGDVFVSPISFPLSLQNSELNNVYLDPPPELPLRRVDGYKKSYGDAFFIAGADGYFGAPTLAATAFLRAGGGFSRLATPRSVALVAATLSPEIVFLPLSGTERESLAEENLAQLLVHSKKATVVVLGPGLSLHEHTQNLIRLLVERIDVPLIIDGDGLTAIAGHEELINKRKAPTIMTPHLGEMSRLSGMSKEELHQYPMQGVRDVASRYQATVVLKSATSLICSSDGRVYLNYSGSSALATAGSGDVLCGIIAAMIGQGLAPFDATRTGVFLHGYAGELASQLFGDDGVVAGDLLKQVAEALRLYRANYRDIAHRHRRFPQLR